jgi:hypothetical protein
VNHPLRLLLGKGLYEVILYYWGAKTSIDSDIFQNPVIATYSIELSMNPKLKGGGNIVVLRVIGYYN